MESICGIDCSDCYKRKSCKGCMATGGHALGGDCVAANCCHSREKEKCSECCSGVCELKVQLIKEINTLGIIGMPEVTELLALAGEVINLDYPIPIGGTIRFWKDNNIYWGAQLHKQGSNRYYGIAADEKYLLISEYGENGTDPEIVVYKRRKND